MWMPKPRRIEDKEHLDWVRSQPCCMCARPSPSDPHHVRTRGAGGSDYYSIPLCRRCHTEAHLEISKDEYWYELAKLLVRKLEAQHDGA